MKTVYRIDIDRVAVSGVGAERMPVSELRALVENAVERALADAPLPVGRSMQAALQVNVPSLAGGPAVVASAVAVGVVQALGGGSKRG
jgi:hypothetical protein